MIADLKYNHVRECAGLFGNLFAEYVRIHRIVFPASAVCVPIPLHKARERVRGFNQAALFARGAAGAFGLEYQEALVKNKYTRPQTSLSGGLRRKNLDDAFALKNPDAVRGKCVLLFDDVATTGTTLEKAALVLHHGGAKEIWAITIAH